MKQHQVWTDHINSKVTINQHKTAPTGTHPVSPKGEGWVEVIELEDNEYAYDLDDHGRGKADLPTQPTRLHNTPRGFHTIWSGTRSHTGVSGLIDYKGPGSLLFAPPTPGYTITTLMDPQPMSEEAKEHFDKWMTRNYYKEFGGSINVLGVPTPRVHSSFRLPIYYQDKGHHTKQNLCDCVSPYKYVGKEDGKEVYAQIDSRHAELFSLWHTLVKSKQRNGLLKVSASFMGEALYIFDTALSKWVCEYCDYKRLSFEREITKFLNTLDIDIEVSDRTVRSEKMVRVGSWAFSKGIVLINGQPMVGKTSVLAKLLLPELDAIQRLPLIWFSSDNPSADLQELIERPRGSGREVLQQTWIYSDLDLEDDIVDDVFSERTLAGQVGAAIAEAGLAYDAPMLIVLDTLAGLLETRITNDDQVGGQRIHRQLLKTAPNALFIVIQHSPKDKPILLGGKTTGIGTSGLGAKPRGAVNVGRVEYAIDHWVELSQVGSGSIAYTVLGNDIPSVTTWVTQWESNSLDRLESITLEAS